MLIELSVRTTPITITRKQAAKNIGRSTTIIDRAMKDDLIDYGRIGRNVYVVVNENWVNYLAKFRK